MKRFLLALIAICILIPLPSCNEAAVREAAELNQALSIDSLENTEVAKQEAPKPELKIVWEPLFNSKDLSGWKSTNFGGEGEVTAKDVGIELPMGYPMTGVTWDESANFKLPNTNYEISLEAKKTSGNDFFCGLTFPVADSHCSLIVGGWGGSLVGLSCIDGHDASENDTKLFRKFDVDRWYRIRVNVTPDKIQVAIDDEWVVNKDISDCKLSVRNETLACRPLGICCFNTAALIRDIKIRNLDEGQQDESK